MNVVAEAPKFDHGDAEDNPMPLPKINSSKLIASAANAPPSTGPQATAETTDLVFAPISERRISSVMDMAAFNAKEERE